MKSISTFERRIFRCRRGHLASAFSDDPILPRKLSGALPGVPVESLSGDRASSIADLEAYVPSGCRGRYVHRPGSYRVE